MEDLDNTLVPVLDLGFFTLICSGALLHSQLEYMSAAGYLIFCQCLFIPSMPGAGFLGNPQLNACKLFSIHVSIGQGPNQIEWSREKMIKMQGI